VRYINSSKVAFRVEAGVRSVSRAMAIIASCVLAIMMLLTVADVSGRYFANRPIPGAWEAIGLLLVIAATWGLARCQIERHHIRVLLLLERFPARLWAIFDCLAYLIGLAGLSLICWQCLIRMKTYFFLGAQGTSDTIGMALWPFMLALAIGVAILAVVLLIDLLHSLAKVVGK